MKKATIASIFALLGAFQAQADQRTFLQAPPTVDEYLAFLKQTEGTTQVQYRGIQIMQPARAVEVPSGGAGSPGAPPQPQAAPPQPEPASEILAVNVQFALDSAVIPESFVPYLSSLAEALRQPAARGKLLVVTGHTDSQGSDAYNSELTMRRAQAVEDYLIALGAPVGSIVSTGKGESELISGHEDDHALNRRVEFRVAG